MKVLHVMNDWLIGGVSQIVYEFIKHSKDTENYVIGFKGRRGFDAGIFEKFKNIGATQRIFDDEQYIGLEEFIKDNKIDIAHKQTGGGDYPNWVKRIRGIGIPVVETLCCPRRSAIPADEINATIGITEMTAKLNLPRKIHVIPQPCDLPVGKPKYPKEKIIVGRLARYEPFKQAEFICSTAKFMYDYKPEYVDRVEFVVAGFPFNIEYFNYIKSMEIPGFLEVIGGVEDKEKFIDNYDFIINPGMNEFNFVFVESMHRGIPCITSYNEYHGTWVEGIKLPFNSPSLASDAIIWFSENREEYYNISQKMVNKAREVDFSPETFVKRMMKVYESI